MLRAGPAHRPLGGVSRSCSQPWWLAPPPRPRSTSRPPPITLQSSGGELAWPELPPACAAPPRCTLLLEVELVSGRARPRVVIAAAGSGFEQQFAPRTRGRRYVDLGPLHDLTPGSRVQLSARGGRIAAPRRLLVFEDPDLDGRRVLVLAPHPDDAEIAAFGLYAGTDSDVVTVTAGDAGGFNYRVLFADPQEHYRIKGRIRTWDSITVPRLGGVTPERARNLGFYDATLARMWRQRPEPVAPPIAALDDPSEFRRLNVAARLRDEALQPTWQGLVADLVAELRAVRPDVVLAPRPLLDAHSDHAFTTVALLEALEALASHAAPERGDGPKAGERAEESLSSPLLLLYTNHMVGAEPWPYGEREARVGPPPLDAVEGLDPAWLGRIHSRPLDEPTRAMKILALEMMHDLRPLDLQDRKSAPEEWREALRATTRALRRERPSYSYLRRAPRPNELYFVLDAEQAQRAVDEFLRRFEARQGAR